MDIHVEIRDMVARNFIKFFTRNHVVPPKPCNSAWVTVFLSSGLFAYRIGSGPLYTRPQQNWLPRV